MQPAKTLLLIAPFVAAFVAAAPGPQITPAPVVAKRGDPIGDLTSAIDDGVDKLTDGVNSALHWGSSVLSNGVTVITDGAGTAYTLATDGGGKLETLGSQVFHVATDEAGAIQTSVTEKTDKNSASSISVSPLMAPATAALFGILYGARTMF
ncbi:hypothetical protein EXIGLDRAFT_732844 [Exidia glandulosa HHB12029]|uniref:Uncharacterized protein n=1 Tax=Exidia glandulosa HHB12029 TaxID=1314781 RepID=A0A165PRV5_EXIGL|nr:hypothetical protein EXIGLDRAFT_732844 [Exidia glandulosa HHB12029]